MLKGAKPGIVMLAQRRLQDAYRQEFLRGEAVPNQEIMNKVSALSLLSNAVLA